MDPIGFGLENFDAIGEWRDREGGKALDASGKLVSGENFNGPAELRAILLSKRRAGLSALRDGKDAHLCAGARLGIL